MFTTDITRTVGALFIGAFISSALSGVVTVQCIGYFKYYPSDPRYTKLLVAALWLLDFCHTIFIGASLWYYLIANYGIQGTIDSIPWSLALTIALTGILTFLVQCFMVHRIHRLSKANWTISVPLAILAVSRLITASITTSRMIHLKTFDAFLRDSRWTFTTGLALSSALDILITGFLFYFLLDSRKVTSAMVHVIDKLMLYAFESGSLTCASTILSMICWLAMPTNLVFMALHFIISKFYANSLLATLNTRKGLQQGLSSNGSSSGPPVPILLEDFQRDGLFSGRSRRVTYEAREASKRANLDKKLKVNVEKTVEYSVDHHPGSPSAYTA